MLPGLQRQGPGLDRHRSNGKPVGSSLIGQSFTDADGNAFPKYFQSRPSAAGDRLRPAGHQRQQPGPGKHRRHARRSVTSPKIDNGYKASLLTPVCSRSATIGQLGRRRRVPPVLHRRRRRRGAVGDRPARRARQRRPPDPRWSASTNRARRHRRPFLATYEGVRVECAKFGEDYSDRPDRARSVARPRRPGGTRGRRHRQRQRPGPRHLARLRRPPGQRASPRPAVSAADQSARACADNTDGRDLGFMGEPRVNVLAAQPGTGPEVSRRRADVPVDDEHVSRSVAGRSTSTRSAVNCASTWVRPRASARPSRCSAKRTAGWSAAPTRRRGRGDPRPQEDRRTARGHRDGRRRSYVDYRGSRFPELDVAAVLGRRPEVVLVDELAHTNTPGSKNAKRWQDVDELLDAGITVISTVNVQHLESLNDVVAQITGIEQQETVPDEVVRSADQIELVDITPEALRRRLVPRQRLRPRTHRRGAVATTSGRATSPRCGNSRCCGWPTRSTPRSRSTAPTTRSPTPGRPANASSSPSPVARSRRRWCAGPLASPRGPAPS